jgi:hypothetical protein
MTNQAFSSAWNGIDKISGADLEPWTLRGDARSSLQNHASGSFGKKKVSRRFEIYSFGIGIGIGAKQQKHPQQKDIMYPGKRKWKDDED